MASDTTPLRPPGEVMRLSRMGAMMATRLSFLRVLVRQLCAERVQIMRPVWTIIAEGHGHAAYRLTFGGHTYSLVAISNDLPEDQRSDRVIATAWDAAFVLYDGVPTAAEIARMPENAPKQDAGRFSPRDLVLSRANKSVRMWDATVTALRSGAQPDADMIRDIGYLMRTTADYGNGKFGIADRHLIADRPGLQGPFAVEMLAVYLIRHFTHDLVEHVGQGRLDPRLARHLGIGNATGLAMAPFLVNHPVLLNNWMLARETAIARVRDIDALTVEQQARIKALGARVARHLAEWHVPAQDHNAILRDLEQEWAEFAPHFDALDSPSPMDDLWTAAQDASVPLQEVLVPVMLEPFGDLVDGLADCMGDPFGPLASPIIGTGALRKAIEADWSWVLSPDFSNADTCRRFWYVSEAKLEPRLGDRLSEAGAELEAPLDIARRITSLYSDLPNADSPVSEFLAKHPDHAFAASRVALLAQYPYADIRDNLIASTCCPIDMLRCKLSFFGATNFDPKSDLWTRITLAQSAPLAHELSPANDDWWLAVQTG